MVYANAYCNETACYWRELMPDDPMWWPLIVVRMIVFLQAKKKPAFKIFSGKVKILAMLV